MRVRSLAPNYRDPMMDDLQIILDQIEHEAKSKQLKAINVTQALQALIANAYREPCLTCGEKPDYVSSFFPSPELKKAGQAVVLYSLCNNCRLDIATKGKVEQIMAEHLKDENQRLGFA